MITFLDGEKMPASEEFNFKMEDPAFYGGDALRKVKKEKIRKAMKTYDLDALLLFATPSVRYVTDFFAKGYRAYSQAIEYLAVVPLEGEPILGYSSGSDEYRVKIRSPVKDARKLPSHSKWPQTITQILKDYGLTKARVGTDMLYYDTYLSLTKLLPDVRFENVAKVWVDITAIKHPLEIEYIQKALDIAIDGTRAAAKTIKDGIREYEVEAECEYAMRMAGTEVQFGILQVASGKNSAIFERIATDKVIRNGELVILDTCSLYRGYQGDLARTFVCGKPTKLQKEIFNVQMGSLRKAIGTIRPGVKCSEVDAAARNYIVESGYGKYMHKFATGHQLGFGFHGEPLIAQGVEETLKSNMVVCLEPRVHLFDQWNVGGVTNEDAILVTETGARNLTKKLEYDEKLLDT